MVLSRLTGPTSSRLNTNDDNAPGVVAVLPPQYRTLFVGRLANLEVF